LGDIERKTDHLIDEVARLKLQNELARIDREWDSQRESFMVTGKDGHRSLPSKTGAIFAMVVAGGFGTFFTIFAGAMSGGLMVPFGLIFIGVGLFAGFNMLHKADKYERAKKRYDHSRSDLLEQLADVE